MTERQLKILICESYLAAIKNVKQVIHDMLKNSIAAYEKQIEELKETKNEVS